MKPRLLLVDEDTTRRLGLVAALRERYEILPLVHGEDPLQVARSLRPEVVLIVLHRARPDGTLRLCRTLRTEIMPHRHVGVLGFGPDAPPVDEVMGPWMAEGYYTGPADAGAILQFADALWRGERPRQLNEIPRASLLGRVLNRFRGG